MRLKKKPVIVLLVVVLAIIISTLFTVNGVKKHRQQKEVYAAEQRQKAEQESIEQQSREQESIEQEKAEQARIEKEKKEALEKLNACKDEIYGQISEMYDEAVEQVKSVKYLTETVIGEIISEADKYLESAKKEIDAGTDEESVNALPDSYSGMFDNLKTIALEKQPECAKQAITQNVNQALSEANDTVDGFSYVPKETVDDLKAKFEQKNQEIVASVNASESVAEMESLYSDEKSYFNDIMAEPKAYENEKIQHQKIIDERISLWGSENDWVDSPEFLASFNAKVAELQTIFPAESYWNHAGDIINGQEGYMAVTNTPCQHHLYGESQCTEYNSVLNGCYHGLGIMNQCVGFGNLMSDLTFGENAPFQIFNCYDNLRVGDIARVHNNNHSLFIIEKTDDYVTVGECNVDCETCIILWGRQFPREDVEKGYFITRRVN